MDLVHMQFRSPSNHCFSLFPRVAESAHKSFSNPFFLQAAGWGIEFPWISYLWVSYPSLCVSSIFSCAKVVPLALSYFSGATALYIDVDLVYLWEEICSTPSYIATLDQNPIYYSFISPFIPSAKIIFHIRKWSWQLFFKTISEM